MILYENKTKGVPNFYSVYSDCNLSWPLHLHFYYECISVNSGTAKIVLDQAIYLLHPGDTVFITLNQLHSIAPCMPCMVTILQFSPSLVNYFTNCFRGLCPADPILHSMPIATEDYKTDNIFHQKELLYGICRRLTQSTGFVPAASSKTTEIVPQIIQYVSRHFQEECNLKRLSEEIGYSYAYLSRTFQSVLQLRFTEYLNQYRIHHASLLLQNSDASVSDIAYQCGYDSLRSFNRNFRAIMKTTPREWRIRQTAKT